MYLPIKTWDVFPPEMPIFREFAQVFNFGPDAFVAAPQAVETRALQPLGCHREIKVGGFRMNSGNPKNCKLSGFQDYGIILSFLYGLEWIDMEAYVHTWACALVLHVLGMVFGGLVWFPTTP